MISKVKIFLQILIAIFILIALAGIYKFNFTNDDIYIQTDEGKVLPYDVYKQQENKENLSN